MAATGENNTSSCDSVYGSGTLDRNDPFHSEGNGTAKFIGTRSGLNKFDFHTMKAANSINSQRTNRLELSKNDLLHMLCYLEGELQARDVVIAALRNERVKQYIHAIRSNHINLDDPHAALFRDKAAITGNHVSRQSSAAAIQADQECRTIIEQQFEVMCQVINKQRQTQSRMISVLTDSLETNQRLRQELEEEKRKHEHDTAQGDDITYGLEMERTKLKQELETEYNARQKLDKDLKKSQETLEFERNRQKQIVLLLLAERKKIIMKYIEERKRSEDLAQILSEEKQRSDTIADGLEEESKKSLRMEAELEKQTITIETERKTWKLNMIHDEKRLKEMEIELLQLRNENETFRKQIALRMGGASPVTVAAAQASKARGGGGGGSSGGSAAMISSIDDVASSSVMNVAKIVQPTATVSSVPVSGPTTGIARSISSGQSLRQTNDPNAVVKANDQLSIVNNSNTTSTLQRTVVIPSTGEVCGATAAATQSLTATILRGGGSGSISASISAATAAAATSTSLINSSTLIAAGRGIPPPIPPNKPIVPPKRETSVSRIGGSNSSTVVGSTSSIITSIAGTINSIVTTAAAATPPPSSSSSTASLIMGQASLAIGPSTIPSTPNQPPTRSNINSS